MQREKLSLKAVTINTAELELPDCGSFPMPSKCLVLPNHYYNLADHSCPSLTGLVWNAPVKDFHILIECFQWHSPRKAASGTLPWET